MLIATAGHIDHGKSTLVRALTGVETDRLPEERKRGISIDLGFAHWLPGEGEILGFVDVPGHERFVKNMLAGVVAADFAMLVVAADDGIMPQTVEHVQILDLLGIGAGMVALTKCDKVPAGRVQEIRRAVEALLAGTALAGSPFFAVSAATGEGVADLAAALREAARQEPERKAAGRNFRLAVDRVFSVPGSGTVVTGTAATGELATGDRLVLSPGGQAVRVRSLQRASHAVDRVVAGDRCALNLSGIGTEDAGRGDWLVVPAMHAPTAHIAARLKILPDRPALRHNAEIHVHLGTADIGARVLMRGQSALAPGSEAMVVLALAEETSACVGDRLIIRDHAGQHTLGGGHVVDPFARRRQKKQLRDAVWAAIRPGRPLETLNALLAIEDHAVIPEIFERMFNLDAVTAAEIYRQADARILGRSRRQVLRDRDVTAMGQQLEDVLETHHRDHPTEPGLPPRQLEAALPAGIVGDVRQAIVRMLIDERRIEAIGTMLRRPGHLVAGNDEETRAWQRLLQVAHDRRESAFASGEIAGLMGMEEKDAISLIMRRRGSGEIRRITDDRFMLGARLAAYAQLGLELSAPSGPKGFSAAQYRDAIGTGRGLAIQILEFFDRIGVTARNGELRLIRNEYERILRQTANLERGMSPQVYLQKTRKGRR